MYNLKKLEGVRVTNVYVDASHETIALYTDKGNFYLDALGDCCSHSWYEHVSGVEALKGAVIRSVRETSMGEVMPSSREDTGEYIQAYGYQFTTDKGYFEIELRNSSNGYYGGWIDFSEESGLRPATMTELNEDF